VRLTIDDAINLAIKNGYTTRIANARVASATAHERGALADALPQLAVSGTSTRSSGRTTIVVPRGALGSESSGSPLPSADQRFEQGATTLTYTQFALTQPVTQLWRIRQAQQFASAQSAGAVAERRRAIADSRLSIERLYASTLIAKARARAADAAVLAKRRQSTDVHLAVASGVEVSAQALGATAAALDAEYARTTAEDATSDAESELRSALALPPGTQIELVVPERDSATLWPYAQYVAQAESTSPEVASARETLEQAKRAVALARADYIPDIGVGVTYTMLNGVSFLPRRAVGLSIQGSWNLFDGGRRSSLGRERAAQEEAAEAALALARDRVAVEVDRAYRAVERAARGEQVAKAALDARRAAVSVARSRDSRGLASAAALADVEAQLAESEAQVLGAELQIRITRAELRRAIGG
jgi:outer membrane protein TolC